MTNVLIGRRQVCFAVLVGLVAIGGLLAVPGDADAVTKAARAKAKKVRAAKKLKALNPKLRNLATPKDQPNLRFIGILGQDTGGNGCYVRAVLDPAITAGVDAGDVITQVENLRVTNTAEADAAVGAAIAAGQAEVVLWLTDVNTGAPNVPISVPLR
jgi:hypothetical protein